MIPECARVGCSAPATTRVVMLPRAAQLVLDDDVTSYAGAALVCDTHADRLQVPKDWTIIDRRSKLTEPPMAGPARNAIREPNGEAASTPGASADTEVDTTTEASGVRQASSKPRPNGGLLERAFLQAERRSGSGLLPQFAVP